MSEFDLSQVTMDRVLGRTREIGGCMEWCGYAVEGRFPQIRIDGKAQPVRRFLWKLVHGPVRGNLWISNTCENPLCVNPDHLVAHTRSRAMSGTTRTLVHRSKIAATKRAKSVLTIEMVRAIRASSEPNPVLAERYGITPGYVSHLRRGGVVWKDFANPYNQLVGGGL